MIRKTIGDKQTCQRLKVTSIKDLGIFVPAYTSSLKKVLPVGGSGSAGEVFRTVPAEDYNSVCPVRIKQTNKGKVLFVLMVLNSRLVFFFFK